MLIVRHSGFVASLRSIIRYHNVVEAHPDSPIRDLRLNQPWPELVAYVQSLPPFNEMDSLSASHIPFPLILLRTYQEWQAVCFYKGFSWKDLDLKQEVNSR
jgi:amyloid beta precursor protein binding protein 1